MLNFTKHCTIAALAIAVSAGAALAGPINTDFETGSLSPWYQDQNFSGGTDWEITTTALDGSYSAYDVGNKSLRQDFAGISTDNILSISFDLMTHDHNFNAYDFFYSDASHQEFYFSGTADTLQTLNVAANLDAGKMLVGFAIYGNSGGATTFDNFAISTGDTAVPEPAALGLMGLGLIALGGMRRRR